METFSFLKYWRGGGLLAATPVPNSIDTVGSANMRTTTTILTAVAQNDDEDSDSDNDDGPFFDLEFAVPDGDEAAAQNHYEEARQEDDCDEDVRQEDDSGGDDEESDDSEDGEGEFNFTFSSGSSQDRTDDPNLTLSPSDDLFFKGKLVPIEPSSIEFNPSEESNSKPQFTVSLLKSVTKFRVFMLGLKKSKSNSNGSEKPGKRELPAAGSVAAVAKEPPQKSQEKPPQEEPSQKQKRQGKLCTVKFKVEEVPISLFARDNSSRISATNKSHTTQRKPPPISASEESASEEKRFPKEVMQKYLKMVKPLYVRVSKRYGEKLRLSGQLNLNGSTALTSNPAEKSQSESEVSEPLPAMASNAESGQKQGSFPAGLRVVCKHLGKSRSASSAVAAAPSAAVVAQRRDDSLLQQQDGIQSAILHCKRSFNASRGNFNFNFHSFIYHLFPIIYTNFLQF